MKWSILLFFIPSLSLASGIYNPGVSTGGGASFSTLTITGSTPTAVLFINDNHVVSGDSPNFVYDSTNSILSIDTIQNANAGNTFSLQAQNGVGTGAGDSLQLSGGSGQSGNAGGGSIVVTAGGAAGTGQAGGVTFTAGTPTNANGKSVTFNATSGVGSNKNGGDINFSAGFATGAGLNGGYKFNGSASGTGKLDFTALGSNRTFSFQDKTGTVALLSDTAGTTNYIQNTLSPTTSTQTFNVQTASVTGSLIVTGQNNAVTQEKIYGATGQSSGVPIWQIIDSTSSNSVLISLDKNGLVQVPNTFRANNGIGGTSYLELTSSGFTKVTGGTTLGTLAQTSTHNGSAALGLEGVSGRPFNMGPQFGIEAGSFTTTAAAYVPLMVKGASGQTANLANFSLDGTATNAFIDNIGDVVCSTNGASTGFYLKSPGGVVGSALTNDTVNNDLQIGNGTNWNGTNMINSTSLHVNGVGETGLGFRGNNYGARLAVQQATSKIGEIIYAAATTPGDLLDLDNNAGTPLTSFASDGTMTISAPSTTQVAATFKTANATFSGAIFDTGNSGADPYFQLNRQGVFKGFFAIDHTNEDFYYANAASKKLQKVAQSGLFSVIAGSATSTFARVGGTLFDHYVDSGNATTTETDLFTDSIPANTLRTAGDKVTAQYGGTFTGAVSSTQELRVYVGTTTILDTGALSIGAATDSWDVGAWCIRESSTVVRCTARLSTNFATLSSYASSTRVGGLDLTGATTLKITGQAAGIGAVSNQITASEGYVEWKPAQ